VGERGKENPRNIRGSRGEESPDEETGRDHLQSTPPEKLKRGEERGGLKKKSFTQDKEECRGGKNIWREWKLRRTVEAISSSTE